MSRISIVVLIALMLSMITPNVWAEEPDESSQSLTLAMPVVEAAATVLLIGLFSTAMRDSLSSTANFSKAAGYRNGVRMQTYLAENYTRLHHDFHLGGGDSMRELADIFEVSGEEYDRFAEELFRRRHSLLELTEPEGLTLERAELFATGVEESLP